jgi:hypothetical protein
LEQADDKLTLYEELAGGDLRDLVLDGTPKPAVGLLNELTVIDRRGEGGRWDVTAQVTDFVDEGNPATCGAFNVATWTWRCIPGDNLGWEPYAAVNHTVVPGDVAVVFAGSKILAPRTSTPVFGLGSDAQQLCRSPLTQAGGTFLCGADLELMTPASAAAQTYQATLTITLVG